MRAVITRNMTVMGDKGTIIHFAKSTLNKPFEEIPQAVYGRLVRAGAARPYISSMEEQNPAEQDLSKAEQNPPNSKRVKK